MARVPYTVLARQVARIEPWSPFGTSRWPRDTKAEQGVVARPQISTTSGNAEIIRGRVIADVVAVGYGPAVFFPCRTGRAGCYVEVGTINQRWIMEPSNVSVRLGLHSDPCNCPENVLPAERTSRGRTLSEFAPSRFASIIYLLSSLCPDCCLLGP